jgi:two-component system NarL family sensor kinase
VTTPAPVPAPPSPVRAVAVFLAAGLLVLTAVGVVLGLVQHDLEEDEGIRDALMLTQTQAGFLVPYLDDGALIPGVEREVLDRIIRTRVLSDQVVEVKLWRQDGTVVYSSDTDLIGEQFELSSSERALFVPGTDPVAEISDLDEEENASQRDFEQLMQVYVAVENADQTRLLFETYHSYDTIADASRQRTLSFLPVLGGGLALLWLAQAPLAWRMASRLRAVHDEREQLLVAALAASDRERQRIAADLHDMVIQRLFAAGLELAAVRRGSGNIDARLSSAAVGVDEGIRELRRAIHSLREVSTPKQVPAMIERILGNVSRVLGFVPL